MFCVLSSSCDFLVRLLSVLWRFEMTEPFHLPGIEEAILDAVGSLGQATIDDIADAIEASDEDMHLFDHHGLFEQVKRVVRDLESAGRLVVEERRRAKVVRLPSGQ